MGKSFGRIVKRLQPVRLARRLKSNARLYKISVSEETRKRERERERERKERRNEFAETKRQRETKKRLRG